MQTMSESDRDSNIAYGCARSVIADDRSRVGWCQNLGSEAATPLTFRTLILGLGPENSGFWVKTRKT